jgi:hypothetical protein
MKETPHQLMLPEPAQTPIVSFDVRRASMPVDGILYPRELAEGKFPDISVHGGWRAYVAAAAPRSDAR